MPKCWKCGSIESYASGIREGLCLDCWCGILNKFLERHHGPGAVGRAIADAGKEARWLRGKGEDNPAQEPDAKPKRGPGRPRKPREPEPRKTTQEELMEAVRWIRENPSGIAGYVGGKNMGRIRRYVYEHPGSRFVMGRAAMDALAVLGISFRRGEATVNRRMRDAKVYLLAKDGAGRLVAGDRESPYIEILDASGLGAMKTERKTKGATK